MQFKAFSFSMYLTSNFLTSCYNIYCKSQSNILPLCNPDRRQQRSYCAVTTGTRKKEAAHLNWQDCFLFMPSGHLRHYLCGRFHLSNSGRFSSLTFAHDCTSILKNFGKLCMIPNPSLIWVHIFAKWQQNHTCHSRNPPFTFLYQLPYNILD